MTQCVPSSLGEVSGIQTELLTPSAPRTEGGGRVGEGVIPACLTFANMLTSAYMHHHPLMKAVEDVSSATVPVTGASPHTMEPVFMKQQVLAHPQAIHA